MDSGFDAAARVVVRLLTREQVEKVADWVAGNPHGSDLMAEVTVPFLREAISNVLASLNVTPPAIHPIAADRLRALADGYAMGQSVQSVQVVWSGPMPETFETAVIHEVFASLVMEARSRLTFMTNSMNARPALVDALRAAVERAVEVVVIVDDYGGGSRSASILEPGGNLAAIPNMQFWRWARGSVPPGGVSVRLAVVDGEVLLLSSADIIGSDSGESFDIGVLIRGRDTAVSVSNQLNALQTSGTLERYR